MGVGWVTIPPIVRLRFLRSLSFLFFLWLIFDETMEFLMYLEFS